MTPKEVAIGAAADGVVLSLSAEGTIKAAGPAAAVARWLPKLRACKCGVAAVLADRSEAIEERAGILEFDGGISRNEAERAARCLTA